MSLDFTLIGHQWNCINKFIKVRSIELICAYLVIYITRNPASHMSSQTWQNNMEPCEWYKLLSPVGLACGYFWLRVIAPEIRTRNRQGTAEADMTFLPIVRSLKRSRRPINRNIASFPAQRWSKIWGHNSPGVYAQFAWRYRSLWYPASWTHLDHW